jgi:hypothetical protein
MALKTIPCGNGSCKHGSANANEHLLHNALHFTASVMGNPEYLNAVKDIPQAKDERMVGIERVNAYQATAHEKRTVKQMKPWSR